MSHELDDIIVRPLFTKYDDVPYIALDCKLCDDTISTDIQDDLSLSDLWKLTDKHECDPGKKLLIAAREIARLAHTGQKYDRLSYFDGHLQPAVLYLDCWVITPDKSLHPYRHLLMAATWCHDVLEDTKIGQAFLSKNTSPEVAALVESVTDEPGTNRKERKAKTYPKIKAYGKLAVAVKIADRMANVHANRTNTKFLKMYRQEQPEFEAALRTPGELEWAWNRLNELLK